METEIQEEHVVQRTWVTRLDEDDRNTLLRELSQVRLAAKTRLPDGNQFPHVDKLIAQLENSPSVQVGEEDECECC